MLLVFRIHYHTTWGQVLCLGTHHSDKVLSPQPMTYLSGGTWGISLEVSSQDFKNFSYNYYLYDEGTGTYIKEWGKGRSLAGSSSRFQQIFVRDYWRSRFHPNYALLSSAFSQALMHRTGATKFPRKEANKY